MKKLLSILILSAVSSMTFAEVTIFNMGTNGGIDVTYRFCTYSDADINNPVCGKPQQVTVKTKGQYTKNYVVLQEPKSSYNVLTFIDKAVAKDGFGKIVSQGSYENNACGNATFESNAAFILDDMQQSPVITCLTSLY